MSRSTSSSPLSSMPDGHSEGVSILVNAEGISDVAVQLIERGVRAALDCEGEDAAEVSVTLLGDEEIRVMNVTYLDRDRPTDVIAFSLGAQGEVLGDVYLGFK